MNVFRPIRHARSSEEVAHQIEALILNGVLRGGDRLPGERELAAETGVSRPIVREAIKSLEEAGIVVARHGEGTYVGDVIGTVFSPQVSRLLASHPRVTMDYLEYRREVESAAVRLAAARATDSDRKLLAGVVKRMEKAFAAGDFDAEAEADVEFHSLIGEIAHNIVLLHTLRACYRLLSEGVFQNRQRLFAVPGARKNLLDQHRKIAGAIIDGDSDGAEAAAREHIDYVVQVTREVALREDRERISGLRLARHNAVA
jgi:GntR family transcriptional regulator, transcriptional repressor for pyruvate dehydrogenase complex